MKYLFSLVRSLALVTSLVSCTRDYSFLEQRDDSDVMQGYDAGADHRVGVDTDTIADAWPDSRADVERNYDGNMPLDARVDVLARDLGRDARVGRDAPVQLDAPVRYDGMGAADGPVTVDVHRYDLRAIDAPPLDTSSPDAMVADGSGADRPVIIFPDAVADVYDAGADASDLGLDGSRDLGADLSAPDLGADVNTLCPEPAPLNTLQAGVCAGSRNSCGPTGWQDDYSSVAGYERNEITIDRLDNDCDEIIDDTAWKEVSAGLFHTCAVRNEGSVECWGSNLYGQRDDIPEGIFDTVTAGAYHNCGLKIDNTIECWGRNSEGQGDVPAGRYIQLDAGYNNTCGIMEDNTIECWGDDSNGQSSTEPSGRFSRVSAGISHACAVKEDQTIECWGNNANGRAPSLVAGNFSQVSAGNQHSCALTSESIECFGRSEQTTSRSGLYSLISSDYDYNCSLDLDGVIACWGVGEGVGGMISPAGNFTQLDVGVYHSCAISLEGLIDCWGREENGP